MLLLCPTCQVMVDVAFTGNLLLLQPHPSRHARCAGSGLVAGRSDSSEVLEELTALCQAAEAGTSTSLAQLRHIALRLRPVLQGHRLGTALLRLLDAVVALAAPHPAIDGAETHVQD